MIDIFTWKSNYSTIEDSPNRIKDIKGFKYDDDTEFNLDHFNELANSEEYENAAEYANKFINTLETEKRNQAENYITNLKRIGRKHNAIYSRLDKDSEDYKFLKVQDAINSNGSYSPENNEIWDKYTNYKQKLGSYEDNIATSLDFIFEPKKQTFAGIDWLAKDNDINNVDVFVERTGYSREYLQNNGIKFSQIDGKDIVHFDKSNPLFDKLLAALQPMTINEAYNIPEAVVTELMNYTNNTGNFMNDRYVQFMPKIKGYDGFGKEIKPSFLANQSSSTGVIIKSINRTINPYTVVQDIPNLDSKVNTDSYYQRNMADIVTNIHSIQNKANSTKERVLSNLGMQTKQYTATIGPSLQTDIVTLTEMRDRGEITEAEYNKRVQARQTQLYEMTKAIGSGQYEMYSNVINEDISDETFRELTNKDRAAIVSLISGTKNLKDMSLLAMVCNGKIGTCISINANTLSKEQVDLLKKYDVDFKTITGSKEKSNARIEVFVPGLFAERAQEKINRNTQMRSAQELNDMQTYGYDYKCEDGSIIRADHNGQFYKNNELLQGGKDEAWREINKDMIITDGVNNLKYNYINNFNQLFDFEGFDNHAKLYAINAANELFPNTPLANQDGTKWTVEDIFSHMSASRQLSTESMYNINYQTAEKLDALFDIYNKLILSAKNYNR